MNQYDNPRGIIPWFTANPVAANLLMLLVISLGIINVGELNREAFPSLEPNRVNISVNFDSGSAQQAEEGIAVIIEQALESVVGIKNITTSSTASGVRVSMEKTTDYDIDLLLKDVKEKMDNIRSFPADADPAVVSKATRQEHAIWLQLYGETDRRTLQRLTDELKTDLLNHPNIGVVSVSGMLDPTLLIEVNKGLLQAYGLTLTDVANAINKESATPRVATLRNQNIYLKVTASEQAYLKNDFLQIPITTLAEGGQLRLADIAKIQDTFDQDSYVLSRFNGQASLGLQVITTGEADISDSVIAAKEVVEKWQQSGRLPEKVRLGTWYDRSESINERLDLMINNAATGALLVFALLAVFLNVTVAFWVAMGLPFIFFGTLFIMGTESVNLTLNMFTTFGFIMALGIVVDDAVVVGESVYTVRSKEGDTIGNTIKGTMMVAVPTLFGVFTTVAAFWAMTNIEGRLGQLYSQFALVVAICLVLSIIESKLILPAHLSSLKTQRNNNNGLFLGAWYSIQSGADKGLQWFSESLYRPAIEIALQFRYGILVIFLAIFAVVISMPFTGAIRVSFFPQIPGDTVRASVTLYNDASYGQTNDVLLMLESTAYETDKQLRRDIADSTTSIRNIQVTSSGDQAGSLRIELDSEESFYTAAKFAQTWQRLAGMPEGVRTLRISSSRETVDALRVELRGNDNNVLEGATAAMIEQLSTISAVTGIEENAEPKEPRFQVTLNEQGRLLGLSTTDLALQVSRNFSNQVVQKFQRDNNEVDVQLGYAKADQESPSELMNTRVILADGTRVPLSAVATLDVIFAETQIERIDGKRSLYLSAEVDKDQMSSTEIVEYLKTAVLPNLSRQFAGVDIYFSGEAEQRAETQSSMIHVFLIAMLLIYGLLAIPLKSYIQPVIIMMAIPFGVIGALLGHWMNDLSLGILSLNGIIALSGVVVNNSLLLVSRFNELLRETSHINQAINLACRNRLRAVLLTSCTTFAGLMPILGETSRQAQFLVPAAVSLAYGIMFSTVITLILIPVLLRIQDDIRLAWKKVRRIRIAVTTE